MSAPVPPPSRLIPAQHKLQLPSWGARRCRSGCPSHPRSRRPSWSWSLSSEAAWVRGEHRRGRTDARHTGVRRRNRPRGPARVQVRRRTPLSPRRLDVATPLPPLARLIPAQYPCRSRSTPGAVTAVLVPTQARRGPNVHVEVRVRVDVPSFGHLYARSRHLRVSSYPCIRHFPSYPRRRRS